MIFYQLEVTDLASCSGVHVSWFPLVEWELTRRGKALYRWPYHEPLAGRNLCLAGKIETLMGAATLCRNVENLEIYLDEVNTLRSHDLSQIIHPSIKNLKLKNFIVNAECAAVILGSNVIKLKIYTKRRRDISKGARKLLFQHKELFQELIICREKPTRSLVGVFPNPSTPKSFKSFSEENVVLDAAGLQRVSFKKGWALRLKVHNMENISDEEFAAISRLPLREFSMSCCNVSTYAFKKSFEEGFNSIQTLSIVNSSSIDSKIMKLISQKDTIRKLRLDLRNIIDFEESLNLLESLVNLKTLVILYCNKYNLENLITLLRNLKQLQTIVLKNYSYCSKSEELFTMYKEKFELLNVRFHYVNVRTQEKISYTFNEICKC